MKPDTDLLDLIAESEGYETWQSYFRNNQFVLLEACVPAICTECGFVDEMEPDQDEGYCEECEANTVKSCLILAGLI